MTRKQRKALAVKRAERNEQWRREMFAEIMEKIMPKESRG